jgi:hypothetical protein
VAARFPDPATRPFDDLDLLVPDAKGTHAALLAAGWRLTGDAADYPEDLHHLPPVRAPDLALPVEVHSRLKWVNGLPAPSFDALAAQPAALGVDGIVEPAPAQHALALAAHLWSHDPLTRVLRVLDIALMAEAADPQELDAVAAAWNMRRLWKSTAAVAAALLGSFDGDPWPLRTWARAARSAREPTVAELHLSRVLSPFAIYPPPMAFRALGSALAGFVRPHDDEPWGRKLQRTAQQLARPRMRRSEHRHEIEAHRRSPRD